MAFSRKHNFITYWVQFHAFFQQYCSLHNGGHLALLWLFLKEPSIGHFKFPTWVNYGQPKLLCTSIETLFKYFWKHRQMPLQRPLHEIFKKNTPVVKFTFAVDVSMVTIDSSLAKDSNSCMVNLKHSLPVEVGSEVTRAWNTIKPNSEKTNLEERPLAK